MNNNGYWCESVPFRGPVLEYLQVWNQIFSRLKVLHFAVRECDWLLQQIRLLAPQSGALGISAYRDFQSHTHTQSTYSFQAFKPFYGVLKQPNQTKADQCRPRQTKASIQVSKNPSIPNMQVCKDPSIPSMQVCKYPKYASMQVCRYASIQVSQVCKYPSIPRMQVPKVP